MGFLDLFKRKKQGQTLTAEQWAERERIRAENRELDDARKNYDLKILVAKKEVELLAIEREKLEIQADITDEFGDTGNESSPDDLLMKFVSTLQNVSSKTQTPTQNIVPRNSSVGVDIPLDEIKKKWDEVPEPYKKVAQEMPDDKLKEYIKSKNPTISDKSLVDSLNVIRGVSPVPPSSEQFLSA